MRLARLIGLAAGIAAIWYLASPWYAQYALRDALERGDAAAVSERVDFPALRSSIKDQTTQRMDAAAGDNILAHIGAVIAESVTGSMVDWLVTPDALRRVMATGRVAASTDSGSDANAPDVNDTTRPPQWHVAYRNLDRFDLVADPEGDVIPPRLIFRRDGLGWKLAGIDLSHASSGSPAS